MLFNLTLTREAEGNLAILLSSVEDALDVPSIPGPTQVLMIHLNSTQGKFAG